MIIYNYISANPISNWYFDHMIPGPIPLPSHLPMVSKSS